MHSRRLPTACLLATFSMLTATSSAWASSIGDPAKGKEAYAQRCAACHSIDYNGTGPAHRGLLGRKAGGVANFGYSAALNASNIIWSEKTLELWLADPEKLIPGQKMWISVSDAAERQNIIAYLRSDIPK